VTLDTAYTARYPDVVPGDYVRLTVSDTGCGMAPEVVERAFEPFFTTKELGAGTGLGLSMVYGFVKQSGGHVRIRSQVGAGTAVELYLPRHVAKGRETVFPAEPTLDETRLRGRETILLVEDDPDIRDFVARTLTGLGYGVREAAHGREALALLAMDGPLDLLLSDMTMPGGIGGHDLVLEARRQRPGLRVLLMSGFTDMAGQLPADCALLEKPFQKLELARAVRLTLDRRLISPPGDGLAE
jgi:CheY-like chemotaxis protein